MDCEEIRPHVADHLTGSLPPHVAEDVVAHLRTCAACAAEIDALDDTWQALGTMPAERPDSAAMRARFNAMLEGYQASGGVSWSPASAGHSIARWRPASTVWRSAAWMSSAAAMLVIGVAIGRQTASPQAPPADPQIASLREEVRDMREMVTISLLQQQSASERLRGVSYSSAIERPGDEVTGALLEALMHDPNVNVRLRTIDALKRIADNEAVRRATMASLPQQSSPIVQVALIDFLMELYGRDAATAVRQLSTDPMVDMAVRARAEQRLAQLGV